MKHMLKISAVYLIRNPKRVTCEHPYLRKLFPFVIFSIFLPSVEDHWGCRFKRLAVRSAFVRCRYMTVRTKTGPSRGLLDLLKFFLLFFLKLNKNSLVISLYKNGPLRNLKRSSRPPEGPVLITFTKTRPSRGLLDLLKFFFLFLKLKWRKNRWLFHDTNWLFRFLLKGFEKIF